MHFNAIRAYCGIDSGFSCIWQITSTLVIRLFSYLLFLLFSYQDKVVVTYFNLSYIIEDLFVVKL